MAPYLPTEHSTDPLPLPAPGTPYDAREVAHVDSWKSSHPQAIQIATLTVTSFSTAADYAFSLNSVPLALRAVAGDTNEAGVAARLAALINTEPLVSGSLIASADAADVTIRGRVPGITFTLSENDTKLTSAATQSAAEAEPIPFGALLVRTGNKSCRPFSASLIAAGVVTLGFTAANTQLYSFVATVGGVDYPVSYTSDGTASPEEIGTGLGVSLTSALPSFGAVVNGDDQLVITGPVGQPFSITQLSAGGAGAITQVSATPATTMESLDLAINQRQDIFERIGALDALPGNGVAAAGRQGVWVVRTEEVCSPGDPVYVRGAADGALTGVSTHFAKSPGAGRVLVPASVARWYLGDDSGDRAVLQLR